MYEKTLLLGTNYNNYYYAKEVLKGVFFDQQIQTIPQDDFRLCRFLVFKKPNYS